MIWPAEDLWLALEPQCPGLTVEILPEIDSTNTELMRRARAGQTDPVLLVAESQTAGRGRLGRAWHGQAGDTLTFSLGLMLKPKDWSGMSLAVGLAIARGLDPQGTLGLKLKWPNDIWVLQGELGQWYKLAGILIETSVPTPVDTQGARYCVIGVGVNIVAPDAKGLNTPPIGLKSLDAALDAPLALSRIAPALLGMVKAFESGGFAPLQNAFSARDALRGKTVVLSSGEQGLAHGVDETGAMMVEINGVVQEVISSEISVRLSA
jgi:BirA family transcriptional regulator, biotin operon repressor / biotin---[acetyl-CoA-carboxylase] ligase